MLEYFGKLAKFESVLKALQKSGDKKLNIYQSRLLLHKLTTDCVDEFPLTSLKRDARILRCHYDLWKGQIGQNLIQEIINDEKAAHKAAADQTRTTAVAADDELDGFSGIIDSTGY